MLNLKNLQSLRARPALLGFLLFFCAGFADGALVPFFPLWARHDAGIGVGFIGLLFGCYAGGELVATPFIGGLADRIGRRPVLIGSSLGVGLGFLGLYFTQGALEAGLVLLMIGMFESVLHPTVITVILESSEEADHRHQISLARMAGSLGRIFGPAAGAIVARFSLGGIFLAAGAALVFAGVMTIAFLTETRPDHPKPEDESEEDDEGFSALLPAFRDKRLAVLLLWFMALELSSSWMEAVLPVYAQDFGAMSPSGIGALFTYSASLVVIAQLPVNAVLKGKSAFLTVLGTGAVLALGFGLLAASASLYAMIGAVTLYALAEMMTGPLVPVIVNRLAPPNQLATYMSAVSVVNDLRDTAGPAIGTMLYALSSRLPWLLGAPLALLSVVGLGAAIKRQQIP